MKKIFFLPIFIFSFCMVYSQNVGIGTTAPAAKLHIRGSADASQLIIDANATQSNTSPLLRLRSADGKDLLHIHSDHASNTFIGFNAGSANKLGADFYDGSHNTFIGSGAGNSNTTGLNNTANGYRALYFNSTGSLLTANGQLALYSNTTGSSNTANGTYALAGNITGNNNTADGTYALGVTTASFYNTALGYQAGWNYDNGYNNTFLGANADAGNPDLYNIIAIGRNSICTAPSQVTIGNSSSVSYRAYGNWSNISDGRFKKNIQENVPGLDFINQLRPVTYNLDATGLDAFLHRSDNSSRKAEEPNEVAKAINNKALQEKEAMVYSGFVAQEVETTAKKLGFNFSGVDAPANSTDVYGLRYAEFVVPLVKGMQEQQVIIKDLQKQVNELKALIKKQ